MIRPSEPANPLSGQCSVKCRWCKVSIFVASLGFGLVISAILALAALGFTLQAGMTNVVNHAYGDIPGHGPDGLWGLANLLFGALNRSCPRSLAQLPARSTSSANSW